MLCCRFSARERQVNVVEAGLPDTVRSNNTFSCRRLVAPAKGVNESRRRRRRRRQVQGQTTNRSLDAQAVGAHVWSVQSSVVVLVVLKTISQVSERSTRKMVPLSYCLYSLLLYPPATCFIVSGQSATFFNSPPRPPS